MRIFLFLAAMLIGACAPMPTTAAPETLAPVKVRPAETAAACATQGGEWRPVCMMGKPACVITFKDGGKSCSDGSECESGRCIAATSLQPDKPAKGVCKVNSDPCGCMQFVEKGVAGFPLCAD